MKKRLIQLLIVATGLVTVFSQCSSKENNNKEAAMNDISISPENNLVRLSMITVDSTQLESYNEYLKEEIEASMRLELGVLTLYAVADKKQPNRIFILEIYADKEAYQKHIATPHFKKYKEGTLEMVQSLELIDTNPLIPGLKIK